MALQRRNMVVISHSTSSWSDIASPMTAAATDRSMTSIAHPVTRDPGGLFTPLSPELPGLANLLVARMNPHLEGVSSEITLTTLEYLGSPGWRLEQRTDFDARALEVDVLPAWARLGIDVAFSSPTGDFDALNRVGYSWRDENLGGNCGYGDLMYLGPELVSAVDRTQLEALEVRGLSTRHDGGATIDLGDRCELDDFALLERLMLPVFVEAGEPSSSAYVAYRDLGPVALRRALAVAKIGPVSGFVRQMQEEALVQAWERLAAFG